MQSSKSLLSAITINSAISSEQRAFGKIQKTVPQYAAGQPELDVMPTNERILGFGSQWYAEAAQHAATVQLPSGAKVNMVSVPYFLITKLDAFEGRGRGDFLMSHDIEDIIAVIDGRPGLLKEMEHASPALRSELAARFKTLLGKKAFVNAVGGAHAD